MVAPQRRVGLLAGSSSSCEPARLTRPGTRACATLWLLSCWRTLRSTVGSSTGALRPRVSAAAALEQTRQRFAKPSGLRLFRLKSSGIFAFPHFAHPCSKTDNSKAESMTRERGEGTYRWQGEAELLHRGKKGHQGENATINAGQQRPRGEVHYETVDGLYWALWVKLFS